MKSAEDYEIDVPAKDPPFWDTVRRRYEKIRYGRSGRIIGYVAAFTFISVFIFTMIMVVGNYSK